MNYHAKILSTDNVLLKNVGKIDPLSIDACVKAGGYEGLKKALAMEPKKVIDLVTETDLLGRGGAFWQSAHWRRAGLRVCRAS